MALVSGRAAVLASRHHRVVSPTCTFVTVIVIIWHSSKQAAVQGAHREEVARLQLASSASSRDFTAKLASLKEELVTAMQAKV